MLKNVSLTHGSSSEMFGLILRYCSQERLYLRVARYYRLVSC